MEMMSSALSSISVDVEAGGREDPLPGPLTPGVGVLAGQRPGQLYPAGAIGEIVLVLPLDGLEMAGQIVGDDRG